ncbi:MAG TPA: hypothetical protein VF773_10930 [Verrucomicrobiae bacterium]
MAEFKIKIGSQNDSSGIKQAEAEVQKLKKEVKSLGDAYREAGGGMKGLGAAGRQAKEMYDQAGGGLKGLFSVIIGGGKQAAAAITALTVALIFGKKALSEFADLEEKVRKLQATMAQNGFLTEANNKAYQELAATLQDLTGRADDEWIDVLTRLTQFGATPQDIERHVEAVKNLAGIMGGDLQGAAAGVAKAMEGEFHAFTRLGIQIDEHATKAEKLDQLYRDLAQKGGGQLAASVEGVTGHFQAFKNTVSDAFEAVGQKIANTGVVQHVLYGLGTTIGWLAGKMSSVVPVADGMRNGLTKLNDTTIDAERFNRQYNESLKETEKWAKAIETALEGQLAAKKALLRADDEQTDAKMAFDLSLVDRMELLGPGKGGISKDEAIRRRAVVRASAGARKFKNEQEQRAAEMQTAQQLIDARNAEIEESEKAARDAQGEVVSDEAVAKQRADLKAMLDDEVSHWDANWNALHASPWDFSNPAIGERAMPRTEADMARAGKKITDKLVAARANRKARLDEFDQTVPKSVEGGRERARVAQELASKTLQKNFPEIQKLTQVIEALQAEAGAADASYRMQSKTAAVTAGNELLNQNPAAKPNRIQDQVFNASGAGGIGNLGSAVHQNTGQFNQVMQEVLKSFREQNGAYSKTKEEMIELRRQLRELQNQFKYSGSRN